MLMLKIAYFALAFRGRYLGRLTDRNVGSKKAIVTTSSVLIAPLSTFAASPRPVITWLSRWAIML